ncbi:SH3 domain-binding glutamic acid-rich-like protein 3 [Mortierella sp. AD011]|nr:SH3 domain-binding glutamic acid-rich-like protein 3 [Mortierella sp. AD010]KAF9372241.1 SH3 domain-binding glutamic acid-rich-like protein 3 [Mortierella sp. AD011]
MSAVYKIKNVQIYGSSVSANLKVKRAQQSIKDTLEQPRIGYEFADVTANVEARKYMRRKSVGTGDYQSPQVFSGGEYRGVFEDFEYAVETHQLAQLLGFDRTNRTKGFVPRPKINYDQSSRAASHAQDGGAEQGAGSPSVVMNGLGNQSRVTIGTGEIGGTTDIATSMYLMSPSSSRFRTGSLPSATNPSHGAMKLGFVQTASQVWNGALKEDITHAKHDFGFTNSLIADDDELDELFQQSAVTETELQAMLEAA